MIHKLGGIALGLAIAIAIMIFAEAIGYGLFGIGVGPDGEVPAGPPPTGVQISILLGWFLAALAGSYAAMWLSRATWTAWVIAVVIVLAVIFRFALAPGPLWTMIAGAIAPLAGAWIAKQLPRKATERSDQAAR